jgi:hypothetical protein
MRRPEGLPRPWQARASRGKRLVSRVGSKQRNHALNVIAAPLSSSRTVASLAASSTARSSLALTARRNSAAQALMSRAPPPSMFRAPARAPSTGTLVGQPTDVSGLLRAPRAFGAFAPFPGTPEIPADSSGISGAQGRNRTADTGIFSPLLYRLSYLRESTPLRGPPGAKHEDRSPKLRVLSCQGRVRAPKP